MIRLLFCSILIFFLLACNSRHAVPPLAGEVVFRTTYSGRQFNDAEAASLGYGKPTFRGGSTKNNFYDLLVRKGIVSNMELDTSLLNLHLLDYYDQKVDLPEVDFRVEKYAATGKQYLLVRSPEGTFQIDPGPRLLGDRFVSYMDIDDDGKKEILIMDVYYVIGGDNFELKYYEL